MIANYVSFQGEVAQVAKIMIEQRLYQKKESYFKAISTFQCRERMQHFSFRQWPICGKSFFSQFNSHTSNQKAQY